MENSNNPFFIVIPPQILVILLIGFLEKNILTNGCETG